MHSTCLRALSALAVGLGLSLGSTSGFAQLFEARMRDFPRRKVMPASCRPIPS
jgi:hypothetical protein